MIALLALIGLVVITLVAVEVMGFALETVALVLLIVVLILAGYRLITGGKLW